MKRIQEDIAKIRRVANRLIASYPKAFTVEDIAKQLQKIFAKRGINLPEQTFFEVVDEVLDCFMETKRATLLTLATVQT